MSKADELAGMFPTGAIVQNVVGNAAPSPDAPSHHVAGIFPVSDGGVVFWDSDVDGLRYVTPSVVDVKTVQTAPALLVRAELAGGGALLVSGNVPQARFERNGSLRKSQAREAVLL